MDTQEWIDEHDGQCGTCHYWTEEDDSCGSYTPKRGVRK